MQCAEFVKRAKDQPYHMLDLLVRIIDHLASSVGNIPNGEHEAQRPPARLLQGALIQALLEDMELRLTHGTLSPQQQAIMVWTGIIDAVEVRA
jgi:hypothetical protein